VEAHESRLVHRERQPRQEQIPHSAVGRRREDHGRGEVARAVDRRQAPRSREGGRRSLTDSLPGNAHVATPAEEEHRRDDGGRDGGRAAARALRRRAAAVAAGAGCAMVNRRQTEALIRRARTIGPTACNEPDATPWSWADLHLGTEPGRRDRRRRGPDPPPGTMAEGPGREVARARQSRRRPGQPDPPV